MTQLFTFMFVTAYEYLEEARFFIATLLFVYVHIYGIFNRSMLTKVTKEQGKGKISS